MSSVLGKFTYYSQIFVRMSAAIAADQALWGIRCPPALGASTQDKALKVRIRSLILTAACDAAVATSSQSYYVQKFTTSDLSGGTDLTAVIGKMNTNAPTSRVLNLQQSSGAGGLSGGTGISQVFAQLGQPRNASSASISLGRPVGSGDAEVSTDDRWGAIVLLPGEGLYIKNTFLGVIGDLITGLMVWEEGTF